LFFEKNMLNIMSIITQETFEMYFEEIL